MSVLIEGVEIPKDKAVSLIICSSGNVYYYGLKIVGKAIEIHSQHGRLIDADKLNEEVCLLIKENMFALDDARDLLETIADAPTVIPASEEAEQ